MAQYLKSNRFAFAVFLALAAVPTLAMTPALLPHGPKALSLMVETPIAFEAPPPYFRHLTPKQVSSRSPLPFNDIPLSGLPEPVQIFEILPDERVMASVPLIPIVEFIPPLPVFEEPRTKPAIWPGLFEPISAVPEPATWAIMLVGFVLCGGALRRRKTRADSLA